MKTPTGSAPLCFLGVFTKTLGVVDVATQLG